MGRTKELTRETHPKVKKQLQRETGVERANVPSRVQGSALAVGDPTPQREPPRAFRGISDSAETARTVTKERTTKSTN